MKKVSADIQMLNTICYTTVRRFNYVCLYYMYTEILTVLIL